MARVMALPHTRTFSTFLMLVLLVKLSAGFSFDLIHRHSPDSPFYEPHLTHQEMTERFNSEARSRYPQQDEGMTLLGRDGGRPVKPKTIHAELEPEPSNSAYLVKVHVGTFSHEAPSNKSYYLTFDTTSEVTWLQCEKCNKSKSGCFPQLEQPFPNSKSTSYKPLTCKKDALCYPGECAGGACSYRSYAKDTGIWSSGNLAWENLTFDSSTHEKETVRMVIGCGTYNWISSSVHQDRKVAGVLGMGWGPRSLVHQLRAHTHDKFSYCLPPLGHAINGSSGFLRLGSHIDAHSNLRSTPLHRHPFPIKMSYYTTLLDMSIGSKKLNIPSHFFAMDKKYYSGGCIIDAGRKVTTIAAPAHQILKKALIQHLSAADSSLKWISDEHTHTYPFEHGYDLCFNRSQPSKGFHHLPSITFHFQGGADLVVQPENAFSVARSKDGHSEKLCLAMAMSDRSNMTYIGGQTQANHVFVFDLQATKLHFGPRDCVKNP